MKKIILLIAVSFLLNSCDIINDWLNSHADKNGEILMLDQQPPKGYNPVFLSDFKDIRLNDSTPNFVISRVDVSDPNKAKVYFHLTQGKYFLKGAESTQYNDIWCNLKLDGYQNIKNYNIKYIDSKDVQNLAIAIVMDLSGSMGEPRARVMQEAVRKVIQNKRPNDLFCLINYDSKVVVECEPTSDVNKLLSVQKVSGLQGFGGLTATLDGINQAVNSLQNVDSKYQKVVMVFTDGSDNSSKFSEANVIENAKQNNVIVNTIDYGYNVIPGLLERTANATKGIYHHIYLTDEFNYVFEDLYFRLNNYYVLEFPQPNYGSHTLNMKVCIKDTTLEDTQVFDNTPEPGAITLLNVYFDTNKSTLKPESNEAMDRLLAMMASNEKIKIEVHGHTDDVGDDESNLKLSQERANAVRDLLVKRGIDANRISATGFGESKPVANNSTPEGRAKNRRTEFIIVK